MLQSSSNATDEVLAPYLRAAHIQPGGQLLELDEQPMWFSQSELRALQLCSEDVVVVEGGAGYGRSAYLSRDLRGWGFQNSILRIRRDPTQNVGAFINYAFQAALDSGQIGVVCNTATFAHFTAEKVAALEIPAPPLPIQLAVVAFLDRETAEIDAFIADQEDLIGLLAERRDAVWQSAVDDLGCPDVPLRRAMSSIVDGPFGSSLTSAHYADNGARVVRLGNIGINKFKDLDQVFISMEYFAELSAHSLDAGDVVVAGLGDDQMPLGRAAVFPDLGPAIVKADCYRVRPNRLATGEYLAWILSAPQTRGRLRLLARGSTRQRLNTSVVREVKIPLPNIADQTLVIAKSRDALESLDATIADARDAIALSRERRAALISAAVTGKIDVRDAA